MDAFLKTWYGVLTVVAFDILALALVICITYRWIFKRIFDFIVSIVCIALLSPIYLVIFISAAVEKKKGRLKKIFSYTPLVGKKGEVVRFSQFHLCDENGELHGYGKWMKKTKFYTLSKFFDLFLGKVSVIGVKALPESDCVFLTDVEEDRHLVRPGFINPLVLKGTKDTDYEDMLDCDKKYAWRFSFQMDCKIFFTWLLKKIRGEGNYYLGRTREKSYAQTLLDEERITQADYDEAMSAGV